MTVVDESNEDSPSGRGRALPKLNISAKGPFSNVRDGDVGDGSLPGSAVAYTPGKSASKKSIFCSTPTSFASTPLAAMMDLQPLKTNLNKLLTPSQTFARLREEKEELSRNTPSPSSHSFRNGFTLPLIGEVKPKVLLQSAKQWLRNPKNLVLLVWGIAVGVSGAILFMVMVGMLNAVIPSKSQRNVWFEVSNQIINALFTLMCVYLHPQRCLHLQMLWRWNADDIVKLRNEYCKNGSRKPHEWGHMLVVVLLLHLNCFAQYALCGLNWGFRRAQRPAIGVGICLCLSIGGAAGAGIYNVVSPLGRDFELESDDMDEEMLREGGNLSRNSLESGFAPRTRIYKMLERRKSFVYKAGGSLVEKPTWRGGLFDVTSDPPISVLSTFCGVCVFGWNMDRMGFGNRYVHIVTFILLCTAPFWIFDLAALNIDNKYVRDSIAGSGVALCAFGLLYGGYWRIRMRERFKLPANRLCCGQANVTDCFQWLFCPICSLCQETRTAEYYDVKDDMFYSRSVRFNIGPGMASPHTPAPTLSAVYEMSGSFESSLKIGSEESLGRDDNTNVMSPPRPMTMPSTNPFLENFPRTSTSAVPLLRPEVDSSVACPTSTAASSGGEPPVFAPNNPFYAPEFFSPNNSLPSTAAAAVPGPPVFAPNNPFCAPELSTRNESFPKTASVQSEENLPHPVISPLPMPVSQQAEKSGNSLYEGRLDGTSG